MAANPSSGLATCLSGFPNSTLSLGMEHNVPLGIGKRHPLQTVLVVGYWGLTPYQQLWSYHGDSKVGNLFSL